MKLWVNKITPYFHREKVAKNENILSQCPSSVDNAKRPVRTILAMSSSCYINKKKWSVYTSWDRAGKGTFFICQDK